MQLKTKVCCICGEEYTSTGRCQKYCPNCKEEANRKVHVLCVHHWGMTHPDKVKGNAQRWNLAHPEARKGASRRWVLTHPEELIQVRRRSHKKSKAKRRSMGFVPLNSPFPGCAGHHVDKELVIHMPVALHKSVWHCQRTGKGMAEINAIAYNYLFKQEVEATIGEGA